MKYNIINKLTLTVNLCILLTAVLIIALLLSSCTTGAESQDNAGKVAEASQPEISVLSFELSDLNGGDIYPGEKLAAIIKVFNSGQEAEENISLELSLPVVILPDSGSENTLTAESSSPGSDNAEVTISGSTAVIENLGAGMETVVEIPLMVAGQLKQDVTDTLGVAINKGSAGEVISDDIAFTVFGVAPYKREEIPIIGLHAIEDEIVIPIELSDFNFDVLCKTLKRFGFETITFTDLLNHVQFGRVLPEKSVIITSDDGFADLYTDAFGILKKYNYKMTVFLVTDFIKETDADRVTNYFDSDRPVPMRPMLIWPEIKEMDQYGCEFLSHSANHIHLGLATDEEFKEELSKSKKAIEDHLGKPVVFFAWPYDNNDPEKLGLLPELGYIGAVRYWGGIENVSTLKLDEIKRVEFNSLIAPPAYAAYLNLHSTFIESKLAEGKIEKGESFLLEYKIKNNDTKDLQITSIELELPQSVSLEEVDSISTINQYPAFKDGKYMWVSDDYIVDANGQISIVLKLKGIKTGTEIIRFRISEFNGYIEADDVEITVK